MINSRSVWGSWSYLFEKNIIYYRYWILETHFRNLTVKDGDILYHIKYYRVPLYVIYNFNFELW